ncbi:MAG: glycogen synthase [Rhodospirillales bacterium]|nr:MAG: glycogen synthase [Rhodospirillales bacterium]
MRVLLMTNEYPPHIYGGAGVHVEYLSRELAKLASVEVRSFHDQASVEGGITVRGTKIEAAQFAGCPVPFVSPLRALATCLAFNGQGIDADVVHCHTWYAQFGGILAKHLYGTPLVLTTHSLEPLRPWKREQIGRGYDLSTWVERTAIEMADAVIAVSTSTRNDVLRLYQVPADRVHVILNGIDTEEYKPVNRPDVLRPLGIDPDAPYVLFVGRMTRQKGLYYLLRAVEFIDPAIQIVLCAGESDTPSLQAELESMVDDLRARRPGVVWIPEMVSRRTTVALYSHAAVFCCPSIYEPFGIINLEAMACGTPVVATAVGGIPEVVADGETGFLVEAGLSSSPPHDPADPEGLAAGLAAAINRLGRDTELCHRMGEAGRRRVLAQFGWDKIAQQTLDLYRSLVPRPTN